MVECDSTKVTFEREKKVRYIIDESEIEFLNNKFNYGLWFKVIFSSTTEIINQRVSIWIKMVY